MAFLPTHRCSSVYLTNMCAETARGNLRSHRGCRGEQRQTRCHGERRWYSDNHTNTWRTATVPRALRDRGLLPGESVCVREAKKAFPREMPSLGSPRWVGVNHRERRKAFQVRGLLCRVVEREICSVQGTKRRPWRG